MKPLTVLAFALALAACKEEDVPPGPVAMTDEALPPTSAGADLRAPLPAVVACRLAVPAWDSPSAVLRPRRRPPNQWILAPHCPPMRRSSR